MDRVDITILGGGPCGLFASFYAGLRGMSVRIIDSLPELGGQLTALYPEKFVFDMPGFPKVLAKDLARDLIAQGTQFDPELALGETASELIEDEEGYTLVTSSGNRYPTRTLIIAAGAGAFSPTKIGVPGEDDFVGRGISYGVRSTEAFRGKRVGVVGGGDSAFDWALHLLDVAESVDLIHRRDVFRAHEDTVRQVQSSAVNMRLFRQVKELHGDDHLQAVTLLNSETKDEDRLEYDHLVVCIGFKSSLGPIKDWGLTIEKNQIVVNGQFETNRSGVFAVGDVATFPGKLKLIATGVGEAVSAVCFAKTRLDPSAKLFPGHSSDLDLGAVGQTP
ncbi:MAG: NAD(P)/FAD-dependent oxidoreductase [Armatimonadetes bacterium]|nr:NAD(P)/FAD-dependent oxidoreductase [Armatimonadota bacterium]